MKRCETCNKIFSGHSTQKYCSLNCKPKQVKTKTSHYVDTIARHEREIIDVMTLVQLERKKIDSLQEELSHYNRLKDYLSWAENPTIETIKEIIK